MQNSVCIPFLSASKSGLWGRGSDPPADFAQQNLSPSGDNIVISLRKIRKTVFFGGRVNAPPLQGFTEMMFYHNMRNGMQIELHPVFV